MVQSDYMLSEMLEQPAILKSILRNPKVNQVAEYFKEKEIDKIIFTGCGDSYCAAWFGFYLASKWCQQYRVNHYEPFELVNYSNPNALQNAVVVGISVSGGTLRVLEAIRFAQSRGATTLTITDNPEGKIVQETDQSLLIHASPPETLLTTSYNSEAAKSIPISALSFLAMAYKSSNTSISFNFTSLFGILNLFSDIFHQYFYV